MKFEIEDGTLVIRLKKLFTGIKYINLFGVLFTRYSTVINSVDWRHEAIHSKQWYETLIIGMLLWYCLEFVIRLCIYRNWNKAYRNISFEKESYYNQYDSNYLYNRKHFSWIHYL